MEVCGYRKDELGRCELDIEDDDVQFFTQTFVERMTTTKVIPDAEEVVVKDEPVKDLQAK